MGVKFLPPFFLKKYNFSGLFLKFWGKNTSIWRGRCQINIYIYIYIYTYICRRVISLSTFRPFWELLVCPTVLSKSHFYSSQKQIKRPKSYNSLEALCFSHIWGLFGSLFENQNLDRKAKGHIGGQTNNFQKYSMSFFCLFDCCFLSFLFFFYFSCSLLMFLSLLLRIYLMLACYKQTRQTRTQRKQERKKERKKQRKQKEERKERKQREAQKEKPSRKKEIISRNK